MNKRALKILFLSRDKYPPFRVDVAVLFGKEMVQKGHNIDWVLQSEADCKKSHKIIWHGGDAYIGPTNNGHSLIHRLQKHLFGLWHNIRCIKLLDQKKYDCVQIKDRFISAILYLAMAKLYGTKFFFWLSFPFAEASLYRYSAKLARYPLVYLIRGIIYKIILYKIIMKYADHILVQSEKMKEDIQAEGIPESKMTAIPMGFDDSSLEFRQNGTQVSVIPAEPRILYLGTLNITRRIDFAIRMFAMVVKEIPEAKLYLVGGGDTEEDIDVLRQEAQKQGILESIVFTGFMERNNALKIVKSADVCISPFYPTPILTSTSPTKLIEYMALGKTVVANDHPEQRLVIEKSKSGICVPYIEKEFAEAVIYLLKHPAINKKMGQVGKKWAYENRSYSVIANNLENTYCNEISKNNAPVKQMERR